jgi:hypothetical protein
VGLPVLKILTNSILWPAKLKCQLPYGETLTVFGFFDQGRDTAFVNAPESGDVDLPIADAKRHSVLAAVLGALTADPAPQQSN